MALLPTHGKGLGVLSRTGRAGLLPLRMVLKAAPKRPDLSAQLSPCGPYTHKNWFRALAHVTLPTKLLVITAGFVKSTRSHFWGK